MEPASPMKLSASSDSNSDIYRKTTNPQCLHLVTSYLEEEQVRIFLNKFIYKLVQVTGLSSLNGCEFEINVVTNSKGKKIEHRQGSTYLHLNDPRVGWALLGKELDGTDRVKVEPREKDDIFGSNSSLDSVKSASSWADMVEEEERWAFSHTTPLPPLVETWPIKYTEEQMHYIKTCSRWDSESVTMEINPARIKDFSKLTKADKEFGCAHNILYSISLITTEKEKDFQGVFSKFAVDNKTEFFWEFKEKKGNRNPRNRNQRKYTTYPVVEFRDHINKEGRVERHAFIFFDPTTFDAQYAFNMRRQVVVGGNHHVFVFARKSIL